MLFFIENLYSMKKIFLAFTLFLVAITTFAQHSEIIESLKQQVVTGQITPEEAMRRAKAMGLDNTTAKEGSKESNNVRALASEKGNKSIFLNVDYIEFPEEGGVDSVAFENIGKEEIRWIINNREDWLALSVGQDSTQRVLAGTLKPGESQLLKLIVTKENIGKVPEEGFSATIDIKSSTGEIVSLNVKWKPIKEEEKKLEYFGYNIFNGAYKAQLNDVGPSDNDYIVAPGDELLLSIWGDVERQENLVVSNDGTVFINNVGQVKFAGESLSDLKEKLKIIMSRSFSSLNPKDGKARSYLDISMAKVTSFPVYIVGNVNRPGLVRVNSMSTAFSALFAVGGPKEDGSLREIEVMRNGKVVGILDLYEYLTKGSLKSDVRLAPKDVVMVPYRKSSVTIRGEINREMIYELKSGETLSDLVRFAGGLKATTDPSIVVINRLAPNPEAGILRTMIKDKLGEYESNKIVVNKLPIVDSDTVMLYAYTGKSLAQVSIEGAVYREGEYALTNGMTVEHLIAEAGGIRDDAHVKKAELIRTLDDGNQEYFNLDLEKDDFLKLKLESRDRVRIYSIWDLKLKRYVKIEGHVPSPGEFQFARNMKISDLIMKAGGLEDDFFRKNTYLERADIIRYNEDKLTTRVVPFKLEDVLNGNESADLELESGDRVIIYDMSMVYVPEQVSIEGAINNSGDYELQTNMTIKDLVVQAGGFQKSAYRSTIEVFRVDPFNITGKKLSIAKKVNVDPGMLLNFDKQDEFKLQDRDIVVVRQYPNFEYQRRVYIGGEVKYPGVYTLMEKNENLKSLIKRAGGLTEEAYTPAIKLMRDTSRMVANFEHVLSSSSRRQVLLQEGDSIMVPRHPGVVRVEGYVGSPGLVQYHKGWTVKDYIEAAGNFTFEASRGKTVVYYPGGNARRRRALWWDPAVKEGSKIVVPKKPEKERVDWVEMAARIASIAASLATSILIIDKNK